MKSNTVIEFTQQNISDAYNIGAYIIRDDVNIEERVQYACTWVKKIVYQLTIGTDKYGLCSALTDGWCYFIGSKQELIDKLNNYENGKDKDGNAKFIKWRFMTEDELLYLIQNRTNQEQLVRNPT